MRERNLEMQKKREDVLAVLHIFIAIKNEGGGREEEGGNQPDGEAADEIEVRDEQDEEAES